MGENYRRMFKKNPQHFPELSQAALNNTKVHNDLAKELSYSGTG